MINASNEGICVDGICVEFSRKKKTQPWLTYCQIAGKN